MIIVAALPPSLENMVDHDEVAVMKDYEEEEAVMKGYHLPSLIMALLPSQNMVDHENEAAVMTVYLPSRTMVQEEVYLLSKEHL